MVPSSTMNILQVSTSDVRGGAERVAWDLFRSYREQGHGSWLAVGRKKTEDPNVYPLPERNSLNLWARGWWSAYTRLGPVEGRVRGMRRLRDWLQACANARLNLRDRLGLEDFDFPSTYRLLELTPQRPDLLHCHNLHGGYFDLRALPWLSRRAPVVLTLHDAWLLSGHCAHSFECQRWMTGCGSCPDLTIYPSIERDGTRWNWMRKRRIYSRSRVYLTTPCEWLMRKVQQSILAPAIIDARVIPYGIDLSTFHLADRAMARVQSGLPDNAWVVMFAADGIHRNVFKDYQTLRAAAALLAERFTGDKLLLIALGKDAPPEQVGRAEIRFVPFQSDPAAMACYYQACDVYLHAARADTFPLVVLEALGCGAPVVATAVGGIPEQIRDGVTGFLTPAGDPMAMADHVETLLKDDLLRRTMGEAAAVDVRQRFDLERQATSYLAWYQDILASNEIAG